MGMNDSARRAVERGHGPVVAVLDLGEAKELHCLHQDLRGIGLTLQQSHDLVHERVERHEPLRLRLTRHELSADARRHDLDDLDRGSSELQPDRLAKRWMNALEPLYVGVMASGTCARPEETVTRVASGRVCMCSMNAETRRRGPRMFVSTTRSASARKPALRTSSESMTPAMATTTFRSGCRDSTWSRAARTDAGSVMSIVTVSKPWSEASRSRTSTRRPPTMTVLPADWRRSARASPMPEVAPGMKMLFPVMSMTQA